MRLYTYGEIDDGVVRDEGARLKRERATLEARLLERRRQAGRRFDAVDPGRLRRICAAVWLERAGEAERL